MTHSILCPDVAAVVVTYHPEPETLSRTLRALVGQVNHIWVVDNGSPNFPHTAVENLGTDVTTIEWVPLGENLGIAAGFNAGIEKAQAKNMDFILLMDQDSQVAPDLVRTLRTTWYHLTDRGEKVAAVGPQYEDAQDGTQAPFFQFGFWGMRRVFPEPDLKPVPVDFLISSGTLIPLSLFKRVGPMDVGLFIDHVDTEWCMRVRAQGFSLYGVPQAKMRHQLGQRRQKMWFFREYQIPHHAAFRYYYMFRNSVLLYRQTGLPRAWRQILFWRCLKFALFFGFIAPNRFQNLNMMRRGLTEGFKGIKGPLLG